jgi:peptidoglycan-associated lipoprotein
MRLRLLAGSAAIAVCLTVGGCKKKVAAAPPPPPPPPATTTARNTPPRPTSTPQITRPEETPATQARMPDAATRARIQELLDRIQDAYFDYNKHTIRPDAEAVLKQDGQTLADIIRQYPDFKLTIEGYCDERGSDEYNLALGDARAKQTKEYLAGLGVPANQLRTISFGKEKAVCSEHDEACWQRNRRAHISQVQ